MAIDQINIMLSIFIIGSLMLLSLILLFNPMKVNRKANSIFALFIILWATYWAEELFTLSGIVLSSLFFWDGLKFFQFFTPILLFLGVKYFTSPFYKFGLSSLKFLVFPIIYLATLMYSKSLPPGSIIHKVLIVMMIAHAIFYTILSLRVLKTHEKRIEEITSNTEGIDLKWIKNVILSLLVLSVLLGFYGLLVPMKNLNIFGNTISFLTVIYVTYYLLKQKEIFDLSEEQIEKIFPEDSAQLPKSKLLNETEIITLREDINKLMKEKRPYLDRELSLKKLAELMQISPHHLSYLLNEGMGENFFQYINRYRAEEAKKLLLSPAHQHLSKMGIAFEAGFNSKTAFNTFFKKHTDMTPTEYVKMRSSG